MSWQAGFHTLSEKFKYLSTSGKLSDVTLIIGKKSTQKVFKAHKLFLSVASEVFEAMFYGPMAEMKEQIEFPADDPDAFEIMMKYIYTGEVEIENSQSALKVFRLADKYIIPQLKAKCGEILTGNISVDSVIQIYDTATDLRESKLSDKCWDYILLHAAKLLQQSYITKASSSTMKRIISEDFINISREIIIYNAILDWSKEQCRKAREEISCSNIRTIIQPLLSEVRFLSMSEEEFIKGPGQDEVLTASEQLSIIKTINLPDFPVKIPNVCSKKKNKRYLPLKAKLCSTGARKVSSLGTFPQITQRSGPFPKDMYIYGVLFYFSESYYDVKLPSLFQCTLTITNVTKDSKLTKTFTEFPVWKEDCQLVLDDPMYIGKGEECEISMTGESLKQQSIYFCYGNCNIDNFSKQGYYHVHGILLWDNSPDYVPVEL